MRDHPGSIHNSVHPIFAPFQGFFEEIEDIKYALQQAAKLNKVYEKTLRKMCMQFGVPYPNPENTVQYRR